MDKSIIELLKKHIIFKQKDLIINFLEKESEFRNIMISNDGEQILNDNFIKLGKELNYLSSQIKYDTNKFKNTREYVSYLGILGICSLNYIPQNYRKILSFQEFSNISDDSLHRIYKTLYNKYLLINKIYETNKDIGLTRYILINNQILKKRNKSIGDFYNYKLLEIQDIIYVTSDLSEINKYKSGDLADKILQKKLLNNIKI